MLANYNYGVHIKLILLCMVMYTRVYSFRCTCCEVIQLQITLATNLTIHRDDQADVRLVLEMPEQQHEDLQVWWLLQYVYYYRPVI